MKNLEKIKSPKFSPNMNRDSNELHPAFCFEYNSVSGYRVEDLEKEDKIHLIDKIYRLCKMNWKDIRTSHRHTVGTEKIPLKSIPRPKDLPPELTHLEAFRFNGKKPMLGFRKHEIYYVVIIDKDYTAYKH